MNILEACQDQRLFGPWFRNRKSWQAWFAFLAALFALPMTDEQFKTYSLRTNRDTAPTEPSEEAWLIVGRRGGKSLMMALVGVFLACFKEYRQYLQPGERATVAIIAADRKQARVILRYVRGMLTNIPMLRSMIERETAEGFDLNNLVSIEIGTANFRTTRGYSYAAVLVDEIAFLRTGDEVANPDYEVLAALRPGLASIPGAMLLCASSPHARRGELWDAYRKFWGRIEKPLVWKATTREMNPLVSERIIAEALERDVPRASAEFLAEFRRDIEAFVTREVVEACVENGVFERPRNHNMLHVAFVDPSGGSNDAMALAIGHAEGERVVLDALRELNPPFSPEAVVREFAGTLKSYGIFEVTGDRYAGEWPREQFRKCGIAYRVCERPKSELYRDLLPKLNSSQVDLLDNPKLVNQIVGLERRVARGGKESIDHAPGAHDDSCNCFAGLCAVISAEDQDVPMGGSIKGGYIRPKPNVLSF